METRNPSSPGRRTRAARQDQLLPFRHPPRKRQKPMNRGAQEGPEDEWNREFFTVSVENLMDFLKLLMSSKDLKTVAVNDLASEPQKWLEFYLGECNPIEERLDDFRRDRWSRVYYLLKSPLPASILDVEPLKNPYGRVDPVDRLRKGWVRRDEKSEKKLKFEKLNEEKANQTLAVTGKPITGPVTESRRTLKAVKEKLLQNIASVLQHYRSQGRLTRRSEKKMFEVLSTGKVPQDLYGALDPGAIGLFFNDTRILKMSQKGKNQAEIVFKDFTSS